MHELKPESSRMLNKALISRIATNAILRLSLGLICGIAIAQEIGKRKPSEQEPAIAGSVAGSEDKANVQEQGDTQDSYDAARQSLSWMTRSLQQMADKLDSISSKLDPNASEEEINREVKRAMREAFADFLPASAIPNPILSNGKPSPKKPIKPVAEIDSSTKQFDSPIWDSTTPAWVKDRVVDQEVVRVAIESSVESSAQECRESMDQQMAELVRKVLDDYILSHAKASEIDQLTPEYLNSKLLRPNTEYELVLDRPSGTYYQLFRLVHIGPDQIQQIQRWERDSVTAKRVQWLSGSAVSALMLLASASGISGLLAKRSKRRVG